MIRRSHDIPFIHDDAFLPVLLKKSPIQQFERIELAIILASAENYLRKTS